MYFLSAYLRCYMVLFDFVITTPSNLKKTSYKITWIDLLIPLREYIISYRCLINNLNQKPKIVFLFYIQLYIYYID